MPLRFETKRHLSCGCAAGRVGGPASLLRAELAGAEGGEVSVDEGQ